MRKIKYILLWALLISAFQFTNYNSVYAEDKSLENEDTLHEEWNEADYFGEQKEYDISILRAFNPLTRGVDLVRIQRITQYNYGENTWWVSTMSLDGSVVFCLDPTTAAGFDLQYEPTSDWANIPRETQQRIWNVVRFGYQTYWSDDYYVASQVLVWKALGYDVTLVDMDISSHISQIESNIANYSKKPSFASGTYELEYLEEITLTDENNVLSNYNVSCGKDIACSVNGNNLTLQITGLHYPKTNGVLVSKQGNGSADSIGLVWVLPGAQTVADIPTRDPGVSHNFNLKMLTGDIKLFKQDEYLNPVYAGTEFAVFWDEDLQQPIKDADGNDFVVNADGFLLIEDLLPYNRTYWFKEVTTTHQYQLDPQVFSITIGKDDLYKVVTDYFVNELANVSLTTVKRDKDNNWLINDAIFEIYEISTDSRSIDIDKAPTNFGPAEGANNKPDFDYNALISYFITDGVDIDDTFDYNDRKYTIIDVTETEVVLEAALYDLNLNDGTTIVDSEYSFYVEIPGTPINYGTYESSYTHFVELGAAINLYDLFSANPYLDFTMDSNLFASIEDGILTGNKIGRFNLTVTTAPAPITLADFKPTDMIGDTVKIKGVEYEIIDATRITHYYTLDDGSTVTNEDIGVGLSIGDIISYNGSDYEITDIEEKVFTSFTIEDANGVQKTIVDEPFLMPEGTVIGTFEFVVNADNGSKGDYYKVEKLKFAEGMTGHIYLHVGDRFNHNYPIENYAVEIYDDDLGTTLLFEGISDENGMVDLTDKLEAGTYYWNNPGYDGLSEVVIEQQKGGTLTLNDLKHGSTYMACEILPEGYDYDSNMCYEVSMNLAEGVSKESKTVLNKKRYLSTRLYKVNDNKSILLNGAVFEVYDVTYTSQDPNTYNWVQLTGFPMPMLGSEEFIGRFVSGALFIYDYDNVQINQDIPAVGKNVERVPNVGVKYTIYTDEAMTTTIGEYETDANGEILLYPKDGVYYILKEDEIEPVEYFVSKGSFYIGEIAYDAALRIEELKAPGGYYINGSGVEIVTPQSEYGIERFDYYRINKAIVIQKTGDE